jgi:hypothetical protein
MATLVRIVLLMLVFALPARAQNIEIGNGLLCDTQRQVELYVDLYDGDVQSTVRAVNAEANDPTACMIATTAFVRGARVSVIGNRYGIFQVVRIVVIGVVTDDQVEDVIPTTFFTLFEMDEDQYQTVALNGPGGN